jgi:hypothetical protein
MHYSITSWSSDYKVPPYEECVEDIHVYSSSSKEIEGTVCQCGKTKWHFVKCEHCGQNMGKPESIES